MCARGSHSVLTLNLSEGIFKKNRRLGRSRRAVRCVTFGDSCYASVTSTSCARPFARSIKMRSRCRRVHFPHRVKDYLAWVEPSGFRVFLISWNLTRTKKFGRGVSPRQGTAEAPARLVPMVSRGTRGRRGGPDDRGDRPPSPRGSLLVQQPQLPRERAEHARNPRPQRDDHARVPTQAHPGPHERVRPPHSRRGSCPRNLKFCH